MVRAGRGAGCSMLVPASCSARPPKHTACPAAPPLLLPPQSLDFSMIAAHLTPKDIELWKRLAQLSADQGLIRQAIYCYSQVGSRSVLVGMFEGGQQEVLAGVGRR